MMSCHWLVSSFCIMACCAGSGGRMCRIFVMSFFFELLVWFLVVSVCWRWYLRFSVWFFVENVRWSVGVVTANRQTFVNWYNVYWKFYNCSPCLVGTCMCIVDILKFLPENHSTFWLHIKLSLLVHSLKLTHTEYFNLIYYTTVHLRCSLYRCTIPVKIILLHII
jgi:hypothetical protein